jgi:glycosyltransferase involved in cell wall biosynthesis
MVQQISLSTCIVVRNAACDLERCLRSIDGMGEIVVVHDGECSDDTLKVASAHGARVFVRPRVGAPEAHRPFAYSQARGEWILQLDADEFLPEATRQALPQLLSQTEVDAFVFRWPAFDGVKYVRRGPFSRLERPCLFRRRRMHHLGITHRSPGTYGRLCERLDLLIEHRPGYNNYTMASFVRKWLPWSRLEARQILDLESVPRFQIEPGREPPYVEQYRRKRQFPVRTGCLELAGFTRYCLRRGLLWAGPRSWKIYWLSLLRLASVHYYLFRESRRRSRSNRGGP